MIGAMEDPGGQRRRRILSIDGGGIRGLIPAFLIASLEEATGKPARDHFDFIAGTSTGAILAAGVATGFSGKQLVSLYQKRGPELFRQLPVEGVVRRIVTGRIYDVARLREMIAEELGEMADWRINDVPMDILITAKGLDDGHPWYFVKDRPGMNTSRTGNLTLVDCVTASAAAPTYFAPWPVEGIGLLVDGGMGVAGNPVYQACVEAFEYTSAYTPEETIIVSLGTGRFLNRKRPTWLWPWVEWVLSELLRSPGEQQTELVKRHYAAARFHRIDASLPRDIPLDATDRKTLDQLERIGRDLASLVDWQRILDGHPTEFSVTARKDQAGEYARRVS
jgi:predicted acylesterase/phospholipase RssA